MKIKISLAVVLACLTLLLYADGFSSVESNIKRYQLPNGATLLLLPRTGAPIVDFVTFVDVGSIREEAGITGISHFLEHLAFKGTETIGTSNFSEEGKLLAESERLFTELRAERAKGENADPEVMASLQEELDRYDEAASEFQVDNEFSRIMELNGGKNLNAATSYEMTFYMLSLPSNKLELWMMMESDRFTNPVFRQFYAEREVILEEKRMIESSPYRRFTNSFLNRAFTEHPYRNTIIGEEDDIKNISVGDVENYFNRYYGAQNLVFAIVGDIQPELAIEMAYQYLGQIPAGTKNRPVDIQEPPLTEEIRFSVEDNAQPYVMVGYRVPPADHPDTEVLNVIADILGQGRSSRLYRTLVDDKKLAVSTFSYSGLPGRLYDNLFVIGTIPAEGVSIEDCLAEIDEQIELMSETLVTEEELNGVKKRNLKQSIDRLKSGQGLATQLAYYESLFGDYKLLFTELERLEAVDREAIRRVMQEIFVPTNRIIGELRPKGVDND